MSAGRCLPGLSEWGGECLACDRANVAVLVGLVVALFVAVVVYVELSAVSTGVLKVSCSPATRFCT